ncbi:MAG: DUF72 domain-containing protein [Syntrophomonadaceae bacterium]|jgi:uncharacterized protein YecE (DUF72 family)|nr:DUF72 domain-containing protein [Syntrophomonadaceae bacterium]
MGVVYVGTCSWYDHASFYPAGLKPVERLPYYARFFPLTEIDSSFYRLLPARNYALWAQRTPSHFVFDVKLFRVLTQHEREPLATQELAALMHAFRDSLQPLREAGKLRSVLLQMPPWFRCEPQNLGYLEWCRGQLRDFTLAVEFRHASWFAPGQKEATLDFLRRHGLVNVVCDEPLLGSGSIPMVPEATCPELAIVRLHGRNARTWYKKGLASSGERFNYLYSREELVGILDRVMPLATRVRELHLLTNNNFGDYAVTNAADLVRLLQAAADQAQGWQLAAGHRDWREEKGG